MHIIVLRFGPNRSQAGAWMAEHTRWIQQGIDDGVFLVAGSLDDALGGAVLAAGVDGETLRARVAQDPFVVHGVVTPEVLGLAPSRMAPRLADLLGRAPVGSVVA